uniref:Secretory carrier-associated membrane protein n=1 Tax=Varanus komodoensis TaxID=61221 RepID=A0A8D2Q4T4_VARKO
PCFYQNLNDEIPIDYQLIVRRIYQLWIFYSITLVVNLVACLAWWIGGGYGINFGLAMLWLALFSPCSYVCWFRPVYKAFRSDSSFNFMLFFFLMGMQLLLSILQTIGFSGWGAVCVSEMRLIALFLPFSVQVHQIYRGGEGSLQKAQDEWQRGLWRDPPSREDQINNFSGNSLPAYPTVPTYPSINRWP